MPPGSRRADAGRRAVQRTINGTRRWFGVGGLGIQPSELAKVACVFFTALMLERRMHRIDELSYSLLPIGLIVGLVVA